MRIIRNREIVYDTFNHLADDAPLPASGDLIVSLARLNAEHDALLAYVASGAGKLGVKIKTTDDALALAPHLAHLALVAIDLPVFRDGRVMTHARRLRERLGFTGEIRAVGQVLRDQMFFMERCGVNAFEVRSDRSIEDALDAFREFSVTYQAAVDEPLPLYRRST